MPDTHSTNPVRPAKVRFNTVSVWLFIGLIASFTANFLQNRKTDALAVDLAALRHDSEKQIADLRQGQSGLLEQDLLRLDQLTTQLQKSDEKEQQQATALANRMRADLARTVEQRHQEMITAISDLRADLRVAENLKSATANKFQKSDDGDAESEKGPASSPAATPPAPPAKLVSDTTHEEPPVASPASAKKKGFWSKLNPFNRSKEKKQEIATTGLAPPER